MYMPPRLRRLPAHSLPGGLVLLVARSPPARALGLAALASLPAHVALLLPRCRSVHTFGMRFPLDLLWLTRAAARDDLAARDVVRIDDGGAREDLAAHGVVRIDHGVRPGGIRRCRAASAVIEARSGSAAAFLAAIGRATNVSPR
jgi:uncharacterized protein